MDEVVLNELIKTIFDLRQRVELLELELKWRDKLKKNWHRSQKILNKEKRVPSELKLLIKEKRKAVEKEILLKELQEVGWNMKVVAKKLGISYAGLVKRIERLGLK
jgi:DNA-binding NtrC family response regulator